MFKLLGIHVNQSDDIDPKWDDALNDAAREIVTEMTYVSQHTEPDQKRFLCNAGHFKLEENGERVYYVCSLEKSTNQVEIFFSHADTLFKKAYADYEGSESKISVDSLSPGCN